jgi:hypothetical protein
VPAQAILSLFEEQGFDAWELVGECFTGGWTEDKQSGG